jgi:uncharacterized protein YggE
MNSLKQLFTLAFLVTTILAFAQTNNSRTEEAPYIEVTGIAEKEVIPDEIYIKIIIRERYINRTKVTIEEQEEKLKAAVKSIGIDLTNLFLSDANADYVKISWQKKDVLTKKDYTLKVSNATSVGQVFQELEKLEITDASVLKVNHSKIDSLRKEVRIMAIKAAKEKADYLLKAIGEQTGKPLIVTETPQPNIREEIARMPLRSSANFISIDDVPASNGNKVQEIQFQKIKLSSGVYVKFSIK